MRSTLKLQVFLILIFSICQVYAFQDYINQEAERLYMEAKKKCLEQKWGEAVGLFKKLTEDFSLSRYGDDALFWMGYCEERIPEKQQDAFDTFGRLIKIYPNSSWTDDAMIHQVKISERFLLSGKNEYRSFLLDKMNSENVNIKQQAALALGRAGDKRAIPVLNGMKGNAILGQFAEDLLSALGETSPPIEKQVDYDSVIILKRAEDSKEEESAKKIPFIFGSARYDHYVKMLRKNTNWSLQELFAFGLWHILETDQFESYFSRESDYDKYQWYENTWESADPSPGTSVNEIKNEFERRVIFACANFGEPDRERFHGKYLKDRWLTPDDFRAPWDSRGEVYIKYGEPSFESFLGMYTYDWKYYNYNVDFVLSKYKTNIHGDAIQPGETSNHLYRGSYFYDYFINNHEFFYNQNQSLTVVNTPELSFKRETPGDLMLHFTFPTQEFKTLKIKGRETYVLRISYKIFDKNMVEVKSEQLLVEIVKPQNNKTYISKEFALKLNPGKYKFNLEVQDLASDKVAFFNQEVDQKVN
jgi:hypothetical protein